MGLMFKINGSSPYGRERVYFSAAPRDISRYLDVICDEIFSKASPAIYYPQQDYKPTRAELSDMRLFVVPVTEEYINFGGYARDFELGLAGECGIPVLPIVIDIGAVSRFNELSGDMQLLYRSSDDYMNKLGSYLSSVLAGDELAQRVRKAFSAYIFLSYRKMDKEKLPPLMRSIHKRAELADVAIWYDEFLIPGESFNDKIEEALKKSDLFLLAVTPSMLLPSQSGGENYVSAIEYPCAKEQGKNIIAAELEPTDRQGLFAKFSQLPEPIKTHLGEEISEKILCKLNMEARASTPEHDYLMGTAYLGGIDVEVDRERGASLITRAALADFDEACAKLSSMYRNADGVVRDYDLSLKWKRREAEIKWKRLIRLEDGKSYLDFFLCMRELGCGYAEVGRLMAAERVYLSLIEAFRDHMDAVLGEAELLHLPLSWLAGILLDLGKLDEAKRALLQSAELQGEGGEDMTPGELLNLSATYADLADLYLREGNTALGEKYLNEAFIIRERLAREIPDKSNMRMLFESHYAMAAFKYTEGEYNAAYDSLVMCEKILSELINEYDSDTDRLDIEAVYSKLAAVLLKTERSVEAERYFNKSISAARENLSRLDTQRAYAALASAYGSAAKFHKESGLYDKAEEMYLKALEVYERYGGTYTDVRDRLNFARTYYNLASARLDKFICGAKGSKESGEGAEPLSDIDSLFSRACLEFEKINSRLKTAESEIQLSSCYNGICDCYREAGMYEQAMKYAERNSKFTEACLMRLSECDEAPRELLRQLSVSAEHIAACEECVGSCTEADNHYSSCLSIREGLYEKYADEPAYADLGAALANLGALRGDREMLLRAYSIYKELSHKRPGVEKYALYEAAVLAELDKLK